MSNTLLNQFAVPNANAQLQAHNQAAFNGLSSTALAQQQDYNLQNTAQQWTPQFEENIPDDEAMVMASLKRKPGMLHTPPVPVPLQARHLQRCLYV